MVVAVDHESIVPIVASSAVAATVLDDEHVLLLRSVWLEY